MKLCAKRSLLLAVTENIEMRLFSSEEEEEEEGLVVTRQEEEEEDTWEQSQRYRYLEHPLAPDPQEEMEEMDLRRQAEPQPKPSVLKEPLHFSHIFDFTADGDVEMESFPAVRLSDIELVEMKSSDPDSASPPSADKTRPIRWKKLSAQKARHVVKDVICLPREHYMAQLEGSGLMSGQQAALAELGLAARITLDSSWSAEQMESRLVALFQRHFVKRSGQRLTFTYLQSVQSSKVLFVPATPEGGWTGEQVLRISQHGAVYIFSHLNYEQTQYEVSSKMSILNRSDSAAEISREGQRSLVGQGQPHVCRAPERLTLNLDTILGLFRLENSDRETALRVSRENALSHALKEVRKPGFDFRSRPVVSFSEEDEDGHSDALPEFFRLVLLELQQSCVFEGHPEHLFLTYDLSALDDRLYYEAGVLIGWSLAHGGPGPCCLHPALYQLMCGRTPSLDDFDWRDIADDDAQLRLEELHGCSDVKQLSPSLCDWASSCGVHGIRSACSGELAAIYGRLVKHYIYHRPASMTSQFTEGLNSCGGLWDLVKSNWEAFLPLMTGAERRALGVEEFRLLFAVCLSDLDCELRAEEENTVAHWDTVLTMIGDGEAHFSFEDLLLFVAGTDHLPPLGFHQPISLRFYSQVSGWSDPCLPYAFSDSLELFLPRAVPEARDLLVLLTRALHRDLDQRLPQADGDETSSETETY